MDVLTARRLDLITALESGNYDQTTGVLCRRTKDGLAHCCIGVARDRMEIGYFSSALSRTYDANEEVDYNFVEDNYEMTPELIDRLMCINDGMVPVKSERAPNAPKRDFKFIARFLRKVWGLTDVEATLA
jgi:hypothetical protein